MWKFCALGFRALTINLPTRHIALAWARCRGRNKQGSDKPFNAYLYICKYSEFASCCGCTGAEALQRLLAGASSGAGLADLCGPAADGLLPAGPRLLLHASSQLAGCAGA